MTARKITDFINRQTPPKTTASGFRSIRFSSLGNEDNDLLSSENHADPLNSGGTRSVSHSFTNANPLSSFDVTEVTEPQSPDIQQDEPSLMFHNNQSMLESLPDKSASNDSSDLTKTKPLSNASCEKGRPSSTAPAHNKRSSVPAADVSAADIHAILDSFQKDTSKKERRKPSDVAKGKPHTHPPTFNEINEVQSLKQPISEPVISPWITQPPNVDSVTPPSEAEDAQSLGMSIVPSDDEGDHKLTDKNSDHGAVITGEMKKSQTLPAKIDTECNSNVKKTSSSVDSSPLLSRKADADNPEVIAKVAEILLKSGEPDASLLSKSTVTDALPQSELSDKPHRHKRRSTKEPNLTIPCAIGAVIVLFVAMLYFLPISSYIVGFTFGVASTLALVYLYYYLSTPTPGWNEPMKVPSLRDLPPPYIPEIADDTASTRYHRGWFNELSHYNPETYHLSLTHSIYITLEGTQLRLQRPKTNIPRRAMYNEQVAVGPSNFIHQRIFDMLHTKVMLLPKGLVKKRVWSKKYPICIILNRDSKVSGGSLVTKSTSTPNLKSRPAIPPSASSDGGFEVISNEEANLEYLYLFARTSREKEDWFYRFQAASLGLSIPTSLKSIAKTFLDDDTRITGANDPTNKENKSCHEPVLVSYLRYMAKFMPAQWLMQTAQMQSECLKINYISCDPQVLWLNAILGRAFWDFFRESYWVSQVREKIQNKLKKIHLPYFIDELTVVDIDLGSDLPVIRRAGRPYLDLKGLWVDLDVAYAGGFVMALETKVNLLKLKENSQRFVEMFSRTSKMSHERDSSLNDESSVQHLTPSGLSSASNSAQTSGRSTPREGVSRIAAYREDEEDSAESSTDSDEELPSTAEIQELEKSGGNAGGGTSRRFIRFVDRLSKSKYFAKALDNKYIQRGMEYVSNTKLVLQVEVQHLNGTLAVNIPPPPSNRLWYGFRNKPQLKITARPKVGEKRVTMAKITEWIEEKLIVEFQRVVVMPNMDDLIVPLLCSDNPENYGHQF